MFCYFQCCVFLKSLSCTIGLKLPEDRPQAQLGSTLLCAIESIANCDRCLDFFPSEMHLMDTASGRTNKTNVRQYTLKTYVTYYCIASLVATNHAICSSVAQQCSSNSTTYYTKETYQSLNYTKKLQFQNMCKNLQLT